MVEVELLEYREPWYVGRYTIVATDELLVRFVREMGTADGRQAVAMMMPTFGRFLEDSYWTAEPPGGGNLRIRTPSFEAEGQIVQWQADFWRACLGASYQRFSIAEAREYLRRYADWETAQPPEVHGDSTPAWFPGDDDDPFLSAMDAMMAFADPEDLSLLLTVRGWDPAYWRRRWGDVLRARFGAEEIVGAAIKHILGSQANDALVQFLEVLDEEVTGDGGTLQILRETYKHIARVGFPSYLALGVTPADLPWMRECRDMCEDEDMRESWDEDIRELEAESNDSA